MSGRALYKSTFLCLLVVAAVAAWAAEGQPRVLVDAGGRLVISGLPQLLTDAEVKRHLDSGLTTSLVFQGGPQGATKSGAARVDVRFELWDEVYLVTLVDGEGRIESSRQASAEALAEWWSEVEIVLATTVGVGPRSGGQARVSLAVVPFSQAELLDTQRWLTESIGQARSGSRAARGGEDNGAVGVLIATSMQRRAVRTLVWNIPIERRTEP
jgi:hypothetical protein